MSEDPLRNQLILLPLTDKFCYYLGVPTNSWAYYYDVQEFVNSKIDHWRIKKYFNQGEIGFNAVNTVPSGFHVLLKIVDTCK